MAIDALEMHVPYYVKDRGCEALNACKEALEQPAQGLSDVELSLLAEKYTGADGLDVVDYGRAIEQALEDKNT
jgi:hypothetical protein